MEVLEEVAHYFEHHADTDAYERVVGVVCAQFHLFFVGFEFW